VVVYIFTRKSDGFQSQAPAVMIEKPVNIQVPREVSPSGPSPPNARSPEMFVKKQDNYNIVPNDPFDELYGSQNIKDNLRYPERSFGPSVINNNVNVLASSGIADMTSSTLFSPEMVQNGGTFNKVLANDINERQYALA
jgi:hypothetical protein